MTTTPRTPRSTFDPRRSSQEPQRLVLTRQPNATTPELSIEMNPGDSTRRPKRMGWDLNPRDAFTSAGFQGRRRPSGHSRGDHHLKQGRNAREASGTGRCTRAPRGETQPNRATTSQIETTHQTSQRQVAVGMSRNDSKWRESWRSAQALARLPSGGRDSSPQAGGTVSGKPSPPVLRA